MQAHAHNQIALAKHSEKLAGRQRIFEYRGALRVLHVRVDPRSYAEVVFWLSFEPLERNE
jgi:hypothetical protein